MAKLRSFSYGQRIRMVDGLFIGHDGTIIDDYLDEHDYKTVLYTIDLDPSASKMFVGLTGKVQLQRILKSQFKHIKE